MDDRLGPGGPLQCQRERGGRDVPPYLLACSKLGFGSAGFLSWPTFFCLSSLVSLPSECNNIISEAQYRYTIGQNLPPSIPEMVVKFFLLGHPYRSMAQQLCDLFRTGSFRHRCRHLSPKRFDEFQICQLF